MNKTIESVWKEGFIDDHALVAPQVNDLYNRRSEQTIDRFIRRLRRNFYGIVATLKGEYNLAAWFILILAIPTGGGDRAGMSSRSPLRSASLTMSPSAAHPGDAVARAPAGADHLIVTYSHVLDLELCHRLLDHGFRSAGLIGSATKRARFARFSASC